MLSFTHLCLRCTGWIRLLSAYSYYFLVFLYFFGQRASQSGIKHTIQSSRDSEQKYITNVRKISFSNSLPFKENQGAELCKCEMYQKNHVFPTEKLSFDLYQTEEVFVFRVIERGAAHHQRGLLYP